MTEVTPEPEPVLAMDLVAPATETEARTQSSEAESGSAASTTCPSCGEPVSPTDRFCEACGTVVGDAPEVGATCVQCGAPAEEIGTDGYCTRCGRKQPGEREHQEVDLGLLAGVTDRGVTHWRNEDAMALADAGGGSAVLVVCDGVSSSQDPQIASQSAADAALAVLVRAVTERPTQLAAAISDAGAAAQSATSSVPFSTTHKFGPPSCTFVAGVLHQGRLTVGWVGDSRAYWYDAAAGARQLSVDDSWATEQVRAGAMTPEEAYRDHRAHAITRWLGVDSPNFEPAQVELDLPGPGWIILVSDGLWNYATDAADLTRLVEAGGGDEGPLVLARRMTDFAEQAGGSDNITVVAARYPLAAIPAELPEEES